jgi:hypothetical protein
LAAALATTLGAGFAAGLAVGFDFPALAAGTGFLTGFLGADFLDIGRKG